MITIAETNECYKKADTLIDNEEKQNIIDYLANNPKAGVLIQGTGGIRKLRWKRNDKGKSGGVRLIYYYHNERMPLYLLTVFGKGQKANISGTDKKELSQLVKVLIAFWLERENESSI